MRRDLLLTMMRRLVKPSLKKPGFARLPADSLLQLGRLTGLLALLESALQPRPEADHEGEEEDDAEREEGDDLVVRLADQALAVVVRHRRRRQDESEQDAHPCCDADLH